MSDRGVVATNGLKVFAHVAGAGMIPGGTLKPTPSAGYAQTAEDLYLRWKLIDDHGRAAGEKSGRPQVTLNGRLLRICHG